MNNTSFILLIVTSILFSCSPKKQPDIMNTTDTVPGTYGYDLAFLNRYQKTVILSDTGGASQLVIVPGWQARVMTSTANGYDGFSYGWINYKLIESGKTVMHMNAFGGEERLWLGPEGGQYSVYFKPGMTQEFNNWFVPAELDTEGFDAVAVSAEKATFTKQFSLVNYSGNKFNIGIERTISLMGRNAIDSALGISIPASVKRMAYQSDNWLINKGDTAWNKSTGMLSVWMLSMFNPSPGVTIFIPYKKVENPGNSKIVNDDYFGKIPAERLIIEKGIIWFKADGKYRSKIGVPPQRAMNFSGSYDSENKVLTILWCELPDDPKEYVNSKWEIQQDPFSGDAINAYNDGPVEDGSQMGPFYELESSSPAAGLKPGEKLLHRQRIFHFEGEEEELGVITKNLFGVGIAEIKNQFK